MNNLGNGIRKRKTPPIEARGRSPGQKPCPGALISCETVSRKVAAASPFEQIGEEASRIASRGSSFLISHKHGRDSTTVGRPSGRLCRGWSHKRCSEGGLILRLREPRDCLRFRTLGWTSNERSATERLFAPRLEGFLRAQLPRHATSLAARFRLGPFRRSACFLEGADDVLGLVQWDQGAKSWDALAVAFLWARFWFSDVSPLT